MGSVIIWAGNPVADPGCAMKPNRRTAHSPVEAMPGFKDTVDLITSERLRGSQ